MSVFSILSHLFFLKCLFFQLSTHIAFPVLAGRWADASLHLFLCSDTKGRQCHHITCAVSASARYTLIGIASPLQVTQQSITFFTYTDSFVFTDYRREMKAKHFRCAWVGRNTWELHSFHLPLPSNTTYDKAGYSYIHIHIHIHSHDSRTKKKKINKQERFQVLQIETPLVSNEY